MTLTRENVATGIALPTLFSVQRSSLSHHNLEVAAVLRRAVGSCLVIVLLSTAFVSQAWAGDTPNYFYGSDGAQPTATGSAIPYSEPLPVGGTYGGYVQEIGTWTNMQGCTSGRAFNSTDIFDANQNSSQKHGSQYPTGTSLYFYMAGPGVDPSYSVTASLATQESEADQWGIKQGEYALSQYNKSGTFAHDAIVFMDIEGGSGRVNGWNHEGNICGAQTGSTAIPYAVDRWAFDGFFDTVNNGTFIPGVYSSPRFWNQTFGTGTSGTISSTTEWTSEHDAGTATPDPAAFCQGSSCAQWFGGSDKHFEWQYASTNSGAEDWDQIYAPDANLKN